jgi:membrane associated rhomboid family serine protease
MITLWNTGRPIARLFGPTVYAIVWVGAGVGGNLLSYYWPMIMNQAVKSHLIEKPFGVSPHDTHGLGASGSICGMLGLLFALGPRDPFTGMFAVFSAFCVYTGAVPQLGHLAHLGGMAVGAALLPAARSLATRHVRNIARNTYR